MKVKRKNYTVDVSVKLKSYVVNAETEVDASVLAYEDLVNHVKGNSDELEFDYEIVEINE